MQLRRSLRRIQKQLAQCDHLIASAHKTDSSGKAVLTKADQHQVTVAAFLNVFLSWEGFLEDVFTQLMVGNATISGKRPTRYVSPPTIRVAKELLIGPMRYFDFGNHDNVRKIAKLYFKDAYPFEPHLSAVFSDLADLRTMRNASAHISSTTRVALESLAGRLLGVPRPRISLYTLLVSVNPTSPTETIYSTYRKKLAVTAELIANG